MLSPFSPTIQTQVANLYISILGRNPDVAGFSYWTNALATADDTPSALNDIATGFSGTPEFLGIYGNLTPEQAVNTLYQNILGRSSDAGGALYWQSIINSYIRAGIPVSKAYALTANQLTTVAAVNTNSYDSVLILSKQMVAIFSGTIPVPAPLPTPILTPVVIPMVISGANQVVTYSALTPADVITVTPAATSPILNLGTHAGGVTINGGTTPTGSSITLNQLIAGDTFTSAAVGTQTIALTTGHVGGSSFNFNPGANTEALTFTGLRASDQISFTAGTTGNSVDLGVARSGGITFTQLGGSAYVTTVTNNIAADTFNVGGLSAGNLNLLVGNSSIVNIVNTVGNSTFTLSSGIASANETSAAGIPVNNVIAGGTLTINSGAKQITVNSYATGASAGTANQINLGSHTGIDSINIDATNGTTTLTGLTANDSIIDNYTGTTINLGTHTALNTVSIDSANQGSMSATINGLVSGDHLNIYGAYGSINAPNLIDAITLGTHNGAVIALGDLGIGPQRQNGDMVYNETDFTGLSSGDNIIDLNTGSSQLMLGAHSGPITFTAHNIGDGQSVQFSGLSTGDTLNFVSSGANHYGINLDSLANIGGGPVRAAGVLVNISDSGPDNLFGNQININGNMALDIINVGNATQSGSIELSQGKSSTINFLDTSGGNSSLYLVSGAVAANTSIAVGLVYIYVENDATLNLTSGASNVYIQSSPWTQDNVINLGSHTGIDDIHIIWQGNSNPLSTTITHLTSSDVVFIDSPGYFTVDLGTHLGVSANILVDAPLWGQAINLNLNLVHAAFGVGKDNLSLSNGNLGPFITGAGGSSTVADLTSGDLVNLIATQHLPISGTTNGVNVTGSTFASDAAFLGAIQSGGVDQISLTNVSSNDSSLLLTYSDGTNLHVVQGNIVALSQYVSSITDLAVIIGSTTAAVNGNIHFIA